MKVNTKHVVLVNRLRRKYAGNELALDALLYYVLSEGGRADVGLKLKAGMDFFASPEGEAVYADVLARLDSGIIDPSPARTPMCVYDYSHEWTQAMTRKQIVAPKNNNNNN
jgi:hypothetical protein